MGVMERFNRDQEEGRREEGEGRAVECVCCALMVGVQREVVRGVCEVTELKNQKISSVLRRHWRGLRLNLDREGRNEGQSELLEPSNVEDEGITKVQMKYCSTCV